MSALHNIKEIPFLTLGYISATDFVRHNVALLAALLVIAGVAVAKARSRKPKQPAV